MGISCSSRISPVAGQNQAGMTGMGGARERTDRISPWGYLADNNLKVCFETGVEYNSALEIMI